MSDLTQLTMFRQKDVERLFAACVFISPLDTIQQCGWLRPELILNEQIRAFWTKAIERIKPEMAGTQDVAETALQAALECGLMSDILGWMNDVTYSHLPLPYANEISRRAYMTNVSATLGDLARAISTSDDAEAKKIIRKLAELDTEESFKLPDAFDMADEFVKIIRGGQRSLNTFIPSLDRAIGGLERQTLTVLAGLPSTGKTALAWQVARSLAYNGKKVLFFSLEMSRSSVFARAACPAVGIDWKDARSENLTADQIQRLEDEAYKIAANLEDRLIVLGGPKDTDAIWKITAQARPDIVIIDHLRLVKDKNPNEVKRQGMIAERIKEVALNFECSSILIAQLHRLPKNQRPDLSDLRDSGEIEETADVVMMLYSDEIDPKITRRPVECWVRKNRNGQRDKLINLGYDTVQQWFEEMKR